MARPTTSLRVLQWNVDESYNTSYKKKKAYVDIQCFRNKDNKPFIKELGITIAECGQPVTKIYHFCSPYEWNDLSDPLKLTNMEVTHYNGLSWNGGSIPYALIEIFMKEYFFQTTVFIKGKRKQAILQNYLPNTEIIDLQGPPLPIQKTKPDSCTLHVYYAGKVCAGTISMVLYQRHQELPDGPHSPIIEDDSSSASDEN